MRSAECQVAAASMAVVAFIVVAAFGPLRRADSGQRAQWEFVQLPVDSDQLRASVRLARGPVGFHLLLQLVEHSPLGLLSPATMSL